MNFFRVMKTAAKVPELQVVAQLRILYTDLPWLIYGLLQREEWFLAALLLREESYIPFPVLACVTNSHA
jgi:hypothetical protein